MATLHYNVVRVNKNTPGARVEPEPKLLWDGFKSLDFILPETGDVCSVIKHLKRMRILEPKLDLQTTICTVK